MANGNTDPQHTGRRVRSVPTVIVPDPAATIVIPSGQSLTLINCHLYTCGNDLWGGIVVQPGGKLILDGTAGKYTLIEDAKVAVYVQASTLAPSNTVFALDIKGAVFNKNETAILIDNYAKSAVNYPFKVINTIFTSRTLYTGNPSMVWPSNSTLKTINSIGSLQEHYMDLTTYPAAFIKDPVSTVKPALYGVSLNAVQAASAPPSPYTMYGVVLGDLTGTKTNLNLYDNLMNGIYALNSSMQTVNSAFQYIQWTGRGLPTRGIGIYAINTLATFKNGSCIIISNDNPPAVNAVADPAANSFFDCSRAAEITNCYHVIISANDVRSTQTYPAPVLNHAGSFGFEVTSDLYDQYAIDYNRLMNIENAITFGATTGIVTGFTSPSELVGAVDISYNEIDANYLGYAPAHEFCSNAITATDVLGGARLGNILPITVTNNTINYCYRGIYMANWVTSGQPAEANTNYISLEPEPSTSTPTVQYAIEHANNMSSAQIIDNNIAGFAWPLTNNIGLPVSAYNEFKKGIYCYLNSSETVECNEVDNLGTGIEFEGSNPLTSWFQNTMKSNNEGFVLSNNGLTGLGVGPQGSPTDPYDNTWTGTWTVNATYKTYTYNTQKPYLTSRLYLRQGSPYNPDLPSVLLNGTNLNQNTDKYLTTTVPPGLNFGSNNTRPLPCPSLPKDKPCRTCPSPPVANLLMRAIVAKNMGYAVSPVQAAIINSNQVYRSLQTDTVLMSGDSTLQQFIASNSITGMGVYYAVEQALSNQDLSIANGSLNGYAPTNTIETNYKAFYSAVLDNLSNGNLSIPDSLALVTLAYGCPHTDGAEVFQARALYNDIYSRNIVFPDNCVFTVGHSMIGEENHTSATSKTVEQKFLLYPNPNDGSMYISFTDLAEKEYIIRISELRGKTIVENHLYPTGGVARLDLQLANGMYFVTMLLPDGAFSSEQKIIISR